MEKFVFEAIGTHWQIDIYDSLLVSKKETLLQAIQDRIKIFDSKYSRFQRDSLIWEMSQKDGTYELPEDAQALFALYRKLYEVTGGLVTPLIGNTLVEAGYDADYSLIPKTLHHPLAWDDVLQFNSPTSLTLKQPALLDVGAAGKGYLIDIVGEVLEKNGVRSYCIDAGGDIRHRSSQGEAIRVGLEHPGNLEQVIGVVSVCNQSLCGSAGNRRAWGEFHHIIDPVTLISPRNILAVWVVAKNTLIADGLSTALFFVPAKVLQEHFEFEYLLVKEDYLVEKSKSFSAELY